MTSPLVAAPPGPWDSVRGVLSRWGVGRDRYRVDAGLYALGAPGPDSPVLVTASYRLSFDTVRRAIPGRDAWLLVLETAGINVWCAAGKGTFGTEELVRRVGVVGLAERVRGRTLILPQLGAPGVAGFEVTRRTGFRVVYGPVRVQDLPAFLDAGLQATPEMRRVRFPLSERLMLSPLEFLQALKYFAAFSALAAVWILGLGGAVRDLGAALWPVLGAILTGTLAVPALLPRLPFRAFSLKGWLAGLVWAMFVVLTQRPGPLLTAAAILGLPAVSAFLALNFTGVTTFTSQNGVNKEIRLFARPMGACALAGLVLAVVDGVLR